MAILVPNKENVISEYLGSSPEIIILEFFIKNRTEEFTITQISDGSGVPRTTIWENDLLIKMADDGLIIKSREVGNARLYKLNLESEKAKLLIKLYDKFKEMR